MMALFALPGRRFEWILVAHTVAMFSLVTIFTATSFNIQSVSYIDIRESPLVDFALTNGPLYTYFNYFQSIDVAPIVTFVLNGWLADGLLVSPAFTDLFTSTMRST